MFQIEKYKLRKNTEILSIFIFESYKSLIKILLLLKSFLSEQLIIFFKQNCITMLLFFAYILSFLQTFKLKQNIGICLFYIKLTKILKLEK